MKYLCSDMNYLMDLCSDKMKTYEKMLNDLLKEYKDEKETDVIALCIDIVDVVKKHEYVESLYYQAKNSGSILVSTATILLLKTSDLFYWNNFIGIEDEAYGSDM